jgi:hypothetical protein
MSLFDDLFSASVPFDSDYRRRRDIESLKDHVEAIQNDPNPFPELRRLERRVDQLTLLSRALIELLVTRELATEDELEVLMQQIDLRDGREDGAIGETWEEAPRCGACNHFVNPERQSCVYCGAPIGEKDVTEAVKTATCGKCHRVVPQNDTFFTESGLRCSQCYAP